MNERPWFRAKRLGVGSGAPCSWQGWAVLTAYMTIVVAASILLERKPLALIALIAPLTIALMIIAAKTTDGGWRWRNGGEE